MAGNVVWGNSDRDWWDQLKRGIIEADVGQSSIVDKVDTMLNQAKKDSHFKNLLRREKNSPQLLQKIQSVQSLSLPDSTISSLGNGYSLIWPDSGYNVALSDEKKLVVQYMAEVLKLSELEVLRLLEQRDTEYGRRRAQGLGGIEAWPAYWGIIDLFFTERRMKLEVLLELLTKAASGTDENQEGGIRQVIGSFNKWLVAPHSRWIHHDDTDPNAQQYRLLQLPVLLCYSLQPTEHPLLPVPQCAQAEAFYSGFIDLEKQHLATALFWVHYNAETQGWMQPAEQASEALILWELLKLNVNDEKVRHMVVPCILMALLSILLSAIGKDDQQQEIHNKLKPFIAALDQHTNTQQNGKDPAPPVEGAFYCPSIDDCCAILNLALGLVEHAAVDVAGVQGGLFGRQRVHLAVGDKLDGLINGAGHWQRALRSLGLLVTYSPALWSDWPEGHFKNSARFMKGMVSFLLSILVSGGVFNNLVIDWSDRWLNRAEGPQERPSQDKILGDVASGRSLWEWQQQGKPEPLLDLMCLLTSLYKSCGEDCFNDRIQFWEPERQFFEQFTRMPTDVLEWHPFYNEAHFRLMAAVSGPENPGLPPEEPDCAERAFEWLHCQQTLSNNFAYLFTALHEITQQLKARTTTGMEIWEQQVVLAGFSCVNRLISSEGAQPDQLEAFTDRRDQLSECGPIGVFDQLCDLLGTCYPMLTIQFKAGIIELLGSFAESKKLAEKLWRHFDIFHPIATNSAFHQGAVNQAPSAPATGLPGQMGQMGQAGALALNRPVDCDMILQDLQQDSQNSDGTQRGAFGRMFVRMLYKLLCVAPPPQVGSSAWRYIERMFCAGEWGGTIWSLQLRNHDSHIRRAEFWTSAEPIIKIFRKLLTELDVEDCSSAEPKPMTRVASKLMDELTGGIRAHGASGQDSLFQQLRALLQDGLVAVEYHDEVFEQNFEVDTYRCQQQCTEDALHVILLLLQKGGRWAEAAGQSLRHVRFNKVEDLLCEGHGAPLSIIMQYIGRFSQTTRGPGGYLIPDERDVDMATAPHAAAHAHAALEILNIVQRLWPNVVEVPDVRSKAMLHVSNFVTRLEESLYEPMDSDDTTLLPSLQKQERGMLHAHTSVAIIQLLCLSLQWPGQRQTQVRTHQVALAHMVLGFDLERLPTGNENSYPSSHLLQYGVPLGLKKVLDNLRDETFVTMYPLYACECMRLLYLLCINKASSRATLRQLWTANDSPSATGDRGGPFLLALLQSEWFRSAGASNGEVPGLLRVTCDHARGESVRGKYFHFELEDVPELSAGHPGLQVRIRNRRSGQSGLAVLFGSPNGGSVGNAHGRFDPEATTTIGQFQVNDEIEYQMLGGSWQWGNLQLARAYLLKTVALTVRVALKLKQPHFKELVEELFNVSAQLKNMPLMHWLLQQMDLAEPAGCPERLDVRARNSGGFCPGQQSTGYAETAQFLKSLRNGEQKYDIKGLADWLANNRDIPEPRDKQVIYHQAVEYNRLRSRHEAQLRIKLLLFEGWSELLQVCLVDHPEHRAVRQYFTGGWQQSGFNNDPLQLAVMPAGVQPATRDPKAQGLLLNLLGGSMHGGLLGKFSSASPHQSVVPIASCMRAPISRAVLVTISALRNLTRGDDLIITRAARTFPTNTCKMVMSALIECVAQRSGNVVGDEITPTGGGNVRTLSCTPNQLARRNMYASFIVFCEMTSDSHLPFLKLCNLVQHDFTDLEPVRATRAHLRQELQRTMQSHRVEFIDSLVYDIFHENDLQVQMLAAQAASAAVADPQLVMVLMQRCPGMAQHMLGALAQHSRFIEEEVLCMRPDSLELITVHSTFLQLITAVARTRDGATALLEDRILSELSKLRYLYQVHNEGGAEAHVLPVRRRFSQLLVPVLELLSALICHENTRGTAFKAALELLTTFKNTVLHVLKAKCTPAALSIGQSSDLTDVLTELELTTGIMRMLASSEVLHGSHKLDQGGELQAMSRGIRDHMGMLLDDMLAGAGRDRHVKTVLGQVLRRHVLDEPDNIAGENEPIPNLETCGGEAYTQRQLTIRICTNVFQYFEVVASRGKLKMDVQLFYMDRASAEGIQTADTSPQARSRAQDLIRLADRLYGEAKEIKQLEQMTRERLTSSDGQSVEMRSDLERLQRCRDSLSGLVMIIEMALELNWVLLVNDNSLRGQTEAGIVEVGLLKANGYTGAMTADRRDDRYKEIWEVLKEALRFINDCCEKCTQGNNTLRGAQTDTPELNSNFLMNIRRKLDGYQRKLQAGATGSNMIQSAADLPTYEPKALKP